MPLNHPEGLLKGNIIIYKMIPNIRSGQIKSKSSLCNIYFAKQKSPLRGKNRREDFEDRIKHGGGNKNTA